MKSEWRESKDREIKSLEERCKSLEEKLSGLENYLRSYETVVLNLRNNNTRLDDIDQSMEKGFLKLKVLEKRMKKVPMSDVQNTVCHEDGASYSAIDYFDFEDHFRGSRALIKDRQRQYIPYFKDCKNVVDVGCGRGEFLELLKENDISAKGVDTYDEFVEYCKNYDLDAVCDDGIAYLKKISASDGIFVGQVVEHMDENQIVALCEAAYEKLEDGKYLIIETPNPTSLAIYTHAFYIDPSHIKPVHPLTMQYFLQKTGFKKIEILYTECSKLDVSIPEIKGEGIENADEFNKAMKLVSDTLFGSQDYAIIAKK